MPPREWKLRITDILESIAKIDIYTSGMDLAAFAADEKTIDAIIRHFTIIGEAATYVPKTITESHPEVPWKEMREMRNVVVHVYFGVRKHILWDTIKNNLPPLVPMLKKVLTDAP